MNSYINSVLDYLKQNPNLTEIEIIRYIYITLGEKLSFDIKFQPFGNSKTRQNIYIYHSKNKNDLEKCMETNTGICKSISYILEYILKEFDVDIETITEDNEFIKCPHVYNRIKQKDGREYVVDLQEDIYNIQARFFTKNFGIDDIRSMNHVLSRFEIEQIDRKLGFISNQNYYADEYLYLLKESVSYIDNFIDKARFIIENIDATNVSNMGYIDRQWHHKTILEYFFNEKDFSYYTNNSKIKMIDCYKDHNEKRQYINCISVSDNGVTDIYVYNIKEGRYNEINSSNFINAIRNGLYLHNCSIPGINKELKRKI